MISADSGHGIAGSANRSNMQLFAYLVAR